jgi:hypothetical protein
MNFASVSDNESQKLSTPEVFDARAQVAGIAEGDGYPSENLRIASLNEATQNFVQDCSKPVTLEDGSTVNRYDYEKELALKAAEADPTHKTIPINYAMSFGTKTDRIAKWAHMRAMLSEENPGLSVVPVGGKSTSMYVKAGKSYDAYYVADSAAARDDYIYGRKCYFNTVKIQGDVHMRIRAVSTDRYDFLAGESSGTRHQIHYMLYGYCAPSATNLACANAASPYGVGHYADGYPDRLFNEVPHLEGGRPQIVKLFVADLRDKQFGLTEQVVLTPESTVRGAEMKFDPRRELNMTNIFRYRADVVKNLSTKFTENGIEFGGMRGVPQLLTNFALASGFSLAAQYTPIVLDLGSEKVKTSSLFGGTYFNMAAKQNSAVTGPQAFEVPHLTAWLGGDLVDTLDRSRNPQNFLADFRRQSEDGFLVVPDSDGKVRSSRNLFGDKMEVNGTTYPDGFQALRALASKDCGSSDARQRYLGPWDGDLYNSKLKIWVDRNRNGVTDENELRSLKEAGVVALNTCYIVHNQDADAFGNGTAMRSAFLYQDGDEDITGDEAEILKRLETGKKTDGSDASFRLAIDLIFKADPSQTLKIE